MEYRYTSTEERVYPDRGLVVNFDEIVDWPDGPPADGHWEPTEETRVELDRVAAERAAAEAEQAKTDEKQQSTPPPAGEQKPPGMAGNPGLEVLRTASPADGFAALKSAAEGAKAAADEPTESTPGPAQSAADTTKE